MKEHELQEIEISTSLSSPTGLPLPVIVIRYKSYKSSKSKKLKPKKMMKLLKPEKMIEEAIDIALGFSFF